MSESFTSQKARILAKDRSPSISQIQHEQSKVSFSILSLLQPQDHQINKIQNQDLKFDKNKQQFRREYVQFSLKPHTYKPLIDSKNQFKNINNLFNKNLNQFNQYFESALILTPKMVNTNGMNSSMKSTQKNKSNASTQSKNNRSSKQRLVKNVKSLKTISSQRNIQIKKIKQGNNLKENFIFIQSPSRSSTSKSFYSKGFQSKSKSTRQIVVIQHAQNLQKTRKKNKIKIEKPSKTQNIVPNIESLNTKHKNLCKKIENQVQKGVFSQKQKAKLLNNYWGCEFNVKKKNRNIMENRKSIQNFTKLK